MPPQLEQAAPRESAKSPAPSIARSLTGIDQNDDGIRDDIKAFVENEAKSAAQFTAASSSTVKAEPASLGPDGSKTGAEPGRRTCFDYLLLEPSERERTDQYMRTSSHQGIVGTHPCDPFVSPNLDRLFETDFVRLQSGPAWSETNK